jgi:hypothetical protein
MDSIEWSELKKQSDKIYSIPLKTYRDNNTSKDKIISYNIDKLIHRYLCTCIYEAKIYSKKERYWPEHIGYFNTLNDAMQIIDQYKEKYKYSSDIVDIHDSKYNETYYDSDDEDVKLCKFKIVYEVEFTDVYGYDYNHHCIQIIEHPLNVYKLPLLSRFCGHTKSGGYRLGN